MRASTGAFVAAETIADPAAFLRDLAALHDVEVLTAHYDIAAAIIEIAVEDLTWGVEHGDGYVPRPATLVFEAVSAFSLTAGEDRFHAGIVSNRAAALSHVDAITHGGVTRVDLHFQSPDRWFVECGSVAIREVQA